MRKPKFSDPKQLKKKVDEYFKWAEDNKKPLSVARLGLFIGLSTTQIREYRSAADDNKYLKSLSQDVKEELSDIVGEAYQRIEAWLEEEMLDRSNKKNVVAQIFALKNLGWKDVQDKVIENKTITIDIEDEDDEYIKIVK